MERFARFIFGGPERVQDPSQSCRQDPWSRHRVLGSRGWAPNTDIFETSEAIVLLLDLAGLNKEDIKVVCHDQLLRISGVRLRQHLPGMERIHRIEIDYGPFEKLFRLPHDLDVEKIEASYENGLLKISIPKRKEPHRDPVQIIIVHEE